MTRTLQRYQVSVLPSTYWYHSALKLRVIERIRVDLAMTTQVVTAKCRKIAWQPEAFVTRQVAIDLCSLDAKKSVKTSQEAASPAVVYVSGESFQRAIMRTVTVVQYYAVSLSVGFSFV